MITRGLGLIQSQPLKSETNTERGNSDSTDSERRVQDQLDKRAKQRYDTVRALGSMTDIKFSTTHGENSMELINYVSDAKYSEKGNLTALKYKGEDVKLTAKGKLDGRSANTDNKDILKAIRNAKKEYEGSTDAVVDKRVGFSVSDEARESVRKNVIENTEANMLEMYEIIDENDPNGNIRREIGGVSQIDKSVDYENLEDPNQKLQYDGKIKALRAEAKRYNDLEKKEKDSTKKLLYGTARDLCIVKEINMEMKANERPKSEQGRTMVEEEADANDLTRLERFKKWAKENITGVSDVAISIAGRNALKKAAKPLGKLGKALSNLAKKAGPAIATILNFVAQAITWGAKALEFLSRNLWMVALFLTYLLYDTLKDRVRDKK